MPARLTLFPPGQPALVLWASDANSYLVGRSPDCDLVADDDRLSRRHAALEWSSGGWSLRDLGSKNGTLVDGLAISGAQATPLASTCWLSLGGVEGDFRTVDHESLRADQDRREDLRRRSLQSQARLDPSLDFELLLRRLVESLLDLTSAERAFVLLQNAEGELEMVQASGLVAENLEEPAFSGSVSLIRRALEDVRAVVVSNVADERTLSAQPSVFGTEVRAMMCLPLRVSGQGNGDRTLGAIYLDSRQSGALFDQLDVEILQALADRAAVALSAGQIEAEIRLLVGDLPTAGLRTQQRGWTFERIRSHHEGVRGSER